MTEERDCRLYFTREIEPGCVFVWTTEPHLTGNITIKGVEYEIAGVRKRAAHDGRSGDGAEQRDSG